MAPKKAAHIIENQGAMFANPTQHQDVMTHGLPTVELDGVFYPEARDLTPPLEPPVVSPEAAEVNERRKAERLALDRIAAENRSSGNVQKKTNLASRKNDGLPVEPKYENVSFDSLRREARKSDVAQDGLALASKSFLARACGFEAYTKIEYETSEIGKPILQKAKPVIRGADIATKDPGKQAELDDAYQRFRIIYAGTRNAARRDARRKELN